MYKLSVPISIMTLTAENRPLYHRVFQECGVERVFLCCIEAPHKKSSIIYTDPKKIADSIQYYKDLGYEVGLWLDSLGHGSALVHESSDSKKLLMGNFTPIEDEHGNLADDFCPLDPNLIACFQNALKTLCAMNPDLIMFDDDLRLSVRRLQNLTCCCERHLTEFEKRIGQKIPREKLEVLIYTGGKNRYRSEWMHVQGNSMLNFAKEMRAAVDSVNPSIRLGACSCYDTWDYSGFDSIELARAFAGKTRPFVRTIGNPYQRGRLQSAIENTRMQAKWCRDADIEIFSEGDVYPRPRYNIPARRLELFDLALFATGETDGILKYMFDYNQPIEYETGYTSRHIKNKTARKELTELFSDKGTIGVYVFEQMHKIENREFASEPQERLAFWLSKHAVNSQAKKLFSENAIPTTYYPTAGMPVAVFGENARHIELDLLKNGAILDSVAAQILKARGVDTGLLGATPANATAEYFEDCGQTVPGLSNVAFQKMECNPTAKILTRFLPGNTPASYLYENEEGLRFYILAYDAYAYGTTGDCPNYFNNYYRNRQLPEIVSWLAKKPLPAVCTGHPYLYSIVAESRDKAALSVLLINPFEDEAEQPTVTLAKEYRSARFIHCNGTLKGNTVTISDIEPYGFAAFEVTQ